MAIKNCTKTPVILPSLPYKLNDKIEIKPI